MLSLKTQFLNLLNPCSQFELIPWVSELILWVSELILWGPAGGRRRRGAGGGGAGGGDGGDGVPTTLHIW